VIEQKYVAISDAEKAVRESKQEAAAAIEKAKAAEVALRDVRDFQI